MPITMQILVGLMDDENNMRNPTHAMMLYEHEQAEWILYRIPPKHDVEENFTFASVLPISPETIMDDGLLLATLLVLKETRTVTLAESILGKTIAEMLENNIAIDIKLPQEEDARMPQLRAAAAAAEGLAFYITVLCDDETTKHHLAKLENYRVSTTIFKAE